MLKLCGQSGSSDGVSDMVAVEKRNENTHLEQRAHSVRVLVPQSINQVVRNESASAFKRYEASNSSTG
jgi:hypothetical protein